MVDTLLHRDFGLLWFAGLVSNLGSWATTTALPVFIYQKTGSALATTTVFTVSVLPLLFSSAAGVLVDRWDRRRALFRANLGLAVVTAPLMLASPERLWLVYGCLLALAVGRLISVPAENALLPQLAGRDRLPAANSLTALNDNLGRIIGPILGTTLLTWSGLSVVILADTATFLAASLLIAFIHTRATTAPIPDNPITNNAPINNATIDIAPAARPNHSPKDTADDTANHAATSQILWFPPDRGGLRYAAWE